MPKFTLDYQDLQSSTNPLVAEWRGFIDEPKYNGNFKAFKADMIRQAEINGKKIKSDITDQELRDLVKEELGIDADLLIQNYDQSLAYPIASLGANSFFSEKNIVPNPIGNKYIFYKEDGILYLKIKNEGYVVVTQELPPQTIGHIRPQEMLYRVEDDGQGRYIFKLEKIETDSTLIYESLLGIEISEERFDEERSSYLPIPSIVSDDLLQPPAPREAADVEEKKEESPSFRMMEQDEDDDDIQYEPFTSEENENQEEEKEQQFREIDPEEYERKQEEPEEKAQKEVKAENPPLAINIDYGEASLDHFPIDIYEAYKARLFSFANGAIYAIKQDNDISLDEKIKRIKEIKILMQNNLEKINKIKLEMQGQPIYFGTELHQFFKKDLVNASGLSSKEIELAEAMYVWQEKQRPTRSTKYVTGEGADQWTIEQIEVPRSSKLTKKQKQELLLIHQNGSQPQWFLALPSFAKHALLEIVPTEDNAQVDWSRYQKCHPTILRQIPGEANATRHEIKITNSQGKVISHTTAYRQGAQTSFNMKDAKERQQSANENLKQLLDSEIGPGKKAFEAFHEKWGIYPNDNIKLPVFLCGLLTPVEQAGIITNFVDRTPLSGDQNNTKMVREKEKAAKKYKEYYSSKCEKNNKKMDIEIFNLNIAIDEYRSGIVKPNEQFIQFATEFSNKMRQHVKATLKEPQDPRLEELNKLDIAIRELQNLAHDKKPNPFNRNQNLYTAALCDVITRSMKGMPVINCKSSKDRTGVELSMADAMLIYFDKYKKFPRLNDIGEDRQNFVKIYAELYASSHQLLVANDNSPGAAGIKAGKMLDADIVDKLKSMKQEGKGNVYEQSKQLADFNKPGSFWKKNRKAIGAVLTVGTVVLAATAIGLIATGMLAPAGIAAGFLATKMGLAAMGMAAGAALAVPSVVVGAGDVLEAHQDREHTFESQKKKSQKKLEKRNAPPPAKKKKFCSSSAIIMTHSGGPMSYRSSLVTAITPLPPSSTSVSQKSPPLAIPTEAAVVSHSSQISLENNNKNNGPP
ncbi:MAG: hypothetical protein K0S27_200 [Gammaproteobacteria bacterium]|jgi:hypothetical protein|nr:hypothetical protein [Gammaproteobacteria bacterium]